MTITESWTEYALAGFAPTVVLTDDDSQPLRAECPVCDMDVDVSHGRLVLHGANSYGPTPGSGDPSCRGSRMPLRAAR